LRQERADGERTGDLKRVAVERDLQTNRRTPCTRVS
jgi:hypothetical protein